MQKYQKISVLLVVLLVSVFSLNAYASHSWSGYHWGRTENPFTLKLGDNVSSLWDSYLSTTSTDWSLSSVLDTTIVSGNTNPKNCRATLGRVEVCNSKYGNNGWLGIASIWVNGNHIAQGIVKMNDTYFSTPFYNTPAWKNLVMCQEVGHTLGLDHQDEDFYNAPLGTCMDYTVDPTTNQHPNKHDYDMLETLYAHLDATTTVKQSSTLPKPEIDHSNIKDLGKELRKSKDGRVSLHMREFNNGDKIFTFVFWNN